jgi:hypothetical protein
MWLSSDYDDKQKLQRLIFPEGILYNKKKDPVRTLRVNSLFAPIPQLASFLNGNEKSHSVKNGSKSHLVDPAGQISNLILEYFKQLYHAFIDQTLTTNEL